jgi:hypothetical protein
VLQTDTPHRDTAVRLHIAKISQNFDAQTLELLEAFTPAHVPADIDSAEEAWDLAQYVDLVDAVAAVKGDIYHAARAALSRYVAKGWQQPAKRSLFGRSASLMSFVNEQLSYHEDMLSGDIRQELSQLAA